MHYAACCIIAIAHTSGHFFAFAQEGLYFLKVGQLFAETWLRLHSGFVYRLLMGLQRVATDQILDGRYIARHFWQRRWVHARRRATENNFVQYVARGKHPVHNTSWWFLSAGGNPAVGISVTWDDQALGRDGLSAAHRVCDGRLRRRRRVRHYEIVCHNMNTELEVLGLGCRCHETSKRYSPPRHAHFSCPSTNHHYTRPKIYKAYTWTSRRNTRSLRMALSLSSAQSLIVVFSGDIRTVAFPPNYRINVQSHKANITQMDYYSYLQYWEF